MSPNVSRHVKRIVMPQGQNQTNIADSLDSNDRNTQRATRKPKNHSDIEDGARQRVRKIKLTPQMEDVHRADL